MRLKYNPEISKEGSVSVNSLQSTPPPKPVALQMNRLYEQISRLEKLVEELAAKFETVYVINDPPGGSESVQPSETVVTDCGLAMTLEKFVESMIDNNKAIQSIIDGCQL